MAYDIKECANTDISSAAELNTTATNRNFRYTHFSQINVANTSTHKYVHRYPYFNIETHIIVSQQRKQQDFCILKSSCNTILLFFLGIRLYSHSAMFTQEVYLYDLEKAYLFQTHTLTCYVLLACTTRSVQASVYLYNLYA